MAMPVNGMFQPFAEPRSGTSRFAFTLPTAGRRLAHGRPLNTRRMPFTYILRCADDTLYVGHTEDLASRMMTNRMKGATIRPST